MNTTTRAASAAVLLVGALALSACSSASPTESAATADAATPFTYKDARGKTVDLKSTPKTVVAQSSVAAALLDAGYQVAGAYGELTPDKDGKLSYQAGSLDLKKLTVIGSTYGEFDLDKYALLAPDLLVDSTYDEKTLWYVPAAQAEQIEGIAPSIGVPGTYASTDAAIDTFVDLAGKLGADTNSASLAKEKVSYTTAEEAAEKVAASSGLKVAVMSPSKDTLYVVNPAYVPELTTLKDAGLDVVTPKKAAATVFTEQSWEQASDYQDVDVIFVDGRDFQGTLDGIKDIGAWKNLPAVKAGQVYPWYAAAPYSYTSYAKIYQDFAAELAKSKGL
jgi:iron complex transport system substrate-binding protein